MGGGGVFCKTEKFKEKQLEFQEGWWGENPFREKSLFCGEGTFSGTTHFGFFHVTHLSLLLLIITITISSNVIGA